MNIYNQERVRVEQEHIVISRGDEYRNIRYTVCLHKKGFDP